MKIKNPFCQTERCKHCRAPLFEVVPGKTTQAEIAAFAHRCADPARRDAILKALWIHPGVHCPKGCTTVLVEYGQPEIPGKLSKSEQCHIAQRQVEMEHPEFITTHGPHSRLLACVHCRNFDGAQLVDEESDSKYRNPKYKPLINHRVRQAFCRVKSIQELPGEWWYDEGDGQASCPHFRPDRLFVYAYKTVTGWSEYPEK